VKSLRRLSPRVSKHSRCGVSGVASKAPKPDENPSGMQGNKNEANDYRELYPSKI
jgi:hypothetical protein